GNLGTRSDEPNDPGEEGGGRGAERSREPARVGGGSEPPQAGGAHAGDAAHAARARPGGLLPGVVAVIAWAFSTAPCPPPSRSPRPRHSSPACTAGWSRSTTSGSGSCTS